MSIPWGMYFDLVYIENKEQKSKLVYGTYQTINAIYKNIVSLSLHKH